MKFTRLVFLFNAFVFSIQSMSMVRYEFVLPAQEQVRVDAVAMHSWVHQTSSTIDKYDLCRELLERPAAAMDYNRNLQLFQEVQQPVFKAEGVLSQEALDAHLRLIDKVTVSFGDSSRISTLSYGTQRALLQMLDVIFPDAEYVGITSQASKKLEAIRTTFISQFFDAVRVSPIDQRSLEDVPKQSLLPALETKLASIRASEFYHCYSKIKSLLDEGTFMRCVRDLKHSKSMLLSSFQKKEFIGITCEKRKNYNRS